MSTHIASSRRLTPRLPPAWVLGVGLCGLIACSSPSAPHNASNDARSEDTHARRLPSVQIPTVRSASDSASTPRPARQQTPQPFAGRDSVTVAEWLDALQAELPAIAGSDTVRAQFDRLRAKHGVPDDDALYLDFVRVRTAFEATRAGGYWGLEWRVTDREPQSDHIWTQWRGLQPAGTTVPQTTAIAECDELSALFAFVARGLGLSKRSRVGLLWPTSNHTVAVWAFDAPVDATAGPAGGPRQREIRIVVPTSQIFLDSAEGLDTDGFDPWVQARIFDYTRRDAPEDLRLPATLARAFVLAVRAHGGTPGGVLQTQRNRRAHAQRQAERG